MKVEAWCDGSGTHRPEEPACIGVVVTVDGVPIVEVSEYVGLGTNSLAELRAMRRAFWLLETLALGPATVWSDSEYAIGAATQTWEPESHARLVDALRAQKARLPDVTIAHVRGHSGVWGNELADWLAGSARVRWFAARGIDKPKKSRPRAPGEPAPRGFVRLASWSGAHAVAVEILSETPKRMKIRFLETCSKGKEGEVRYVGKEAVTLGEKVAAAGGDPVG